MKQMRRLFSLLATLLVALTSLCAQPQKATDTLTVVPLQVQQYRVMTPFISDSLNVQGKAYDATDLLQPVNHIKLSQTHATMPEATEGVVSLQTAEDAITTYAIRLRTPQATSRRRYRLRRRCPLS